TFADRPCHPSHVSLFRLADDPVPLAERILGQDVIYVGGGSMRNLLAIWRAHQLDALLCAAWGRGIALAGLSAGAMCWFAGGITRSGGRPEPIAGLGLLAGSLSVHRSSEPERLPAFRAAIRRGSLPAGWALDDGVGVLFEGRRLARALTARADGRAVHVERRKGEVVETELECERLAAPEPGELRVVPADDRQRSSARPAEHRGRVAQVLEDVAEDNRVEARRVEAVALDVGLADLEAARAGRGGGGGIDLHAGDRAAPLGDQRRREVTRGAA